MFKKAFQRDRSERGGKASPLGYVESLSDARTKPRKGRILVRLV